MDARKPYIAENENAPRDRGWWNYSGPAPQVQGSPMERANAYAAYMGAQDWLWPKPMAQDLILHEQKRQQAEAAKPSVWDQVRGIASHIITNLGKAGD
jgi:hypothetical protein